ncbi:MAG: aminotransferase class V-fold PLP-dependent enzyme, partial [Phycisphaerae bacterium]
ILLPDHEYMSGINELQRIASKTGARVVSARIPFPVQSAAEIESAVMQAGSPRTKLAMISHLTSTTSLIFPVESIVPKLKALGLDVLVDGAHSPGQIPLDLAALDPTYFVGSLHKWISAPKGTAFLYVAKHKREGFRPVFLSSRGHKIRPDRALFLRDFDYHGTLDYSGFLVVPEAIAYLGRLLPGGWPELIERNHELALKGRAIVCNAIGASPAAPDSMIGCMASIVLPEAAPEMQSRTTIYDDPLQDNLVHKHGVVTPIWRLASTNQRVVRLSAQAYNTVDQNEKLAEALVTELQAEGALKSTARRAS